MSKAFENQSIDSDFSPSDQSAAKQEASFHAQGLRVSVSLALLRSVH